jgi:dipeptidyl aminopeptidase/acylaminoacyl peptidase
MVFYILGGIMLGLFLLGGGLLLSQAGVRQGLRLPPAWIAGMISPTPVNLLILSTSTPAPLPTVPSQTSPPPSATAVEVATILPEASSYVSPTVTGTAPMVDLPPSIGGADRLAFLNERDIWTSNLDGSDLVRLTTDGSPKTNLRWTPDGKALTYSSEGWVNMLDPATGIVSRIGQFAEFAISPDMQSVVLGDEVEFDKHVYRWQNFLLDYDLEVLHSLNLTRDSRCPFLGGRQTLFSSDSKRLAMVVETSQGERKVEAIYLLALRKCGEQPDVLDIFPGTRFTMRGYSGPKDTPVILDYDWNKDVLFVLHGNFRSGFGDLTLYNTDTTVSQVINPIEERCCYKDLRWSPDGEYLLFAYQDVRYANPAQLYYIPFGMIGTGVSFSPLPLPNYFFSDLKASLQPALREAK